MALSLLDMPNEIVLQIIEHVGTHCLLMTCKRFRLFMTQMGAYDWKQLKKWYTTAFLWYRYGTVKLTCHKTPRAFSNRFDEAYLSVSLAQKLYPACTVPQPDIVMRWGQKLLYKIEHFSFLLGFDEKLMWEAVLYKTKTGLRNYEEVKQCIGERVLKISQGYTRLTLVNGCAETDVPIGRCCATQYYWHALVIAGIVHRNKLINVNF